MIIRIIIRGKRSWSNWMGRRLELNIRHSWKKNLLEAAKYIRLGQKLNL